MVEMVMLLQHAPANEAERAQVSHVDQVYCAERLMSLHLIIHNQLCGSSVPTRLLCCVQAAVLCWCRS